jgi:hypothetical protein
MQELLQCYTSKKVTSKLHKLTNYKSNYTKHNIWNVNTSLCCTECKPPRRWWRQCWHSDFYPMVQVFANTLVVVETNSKVATSPLASGDPQVTLSHMECLPQALALTQPDHLWPFVSCSTRVALRGSHGVSIIPLTITSLEHHTIFSRFSTETTTKPSRRWQPPRVTSTTGLQLDHLVSLNATSRCNPLESHSLTIRSHSCKHKWVRGHPRTPTQATKA